MKKRIFLSLFVLALLVYLGWIFNRLSDSSSFCKSCHFMKPFVENWETSTHNIVDCKDCHWAPGASEYFKGKVRLLSEILRYFAGAYNVQVHSKVKDGACLRCHEEPEITDSVLFHGRIPLSHQAHYRDTVKDIKLPCTGCHYELVQGNHMAVSDDPCFICHFVGGPGVRSSKECFTCHGPPKDTLFVNGIVFSHRDYLEAQVECQTCHVHVTRGSGDVPRESCYKCHVERFEAFGEVKKIHSIHITEEKIKCTRCHSALEHSKIEMTEAISPDCRTCHGAGHSIQEEMYMGTGGKGVSASPDPMFLSNVACFGCHPSSEYPLAVSGGLPLTKATGQSCNICHGEGYGKLLQMWQGSVKSRLSKLDETLSLLEPLLEKKGVASLSERYEEAKANVEIVERDKSFGAHNIRYAISLLDYAEEALNQTLDAILEKKYTKKGLKAKIREECSGCHPDIGEHTGLVQGKKFPHFNHISRYGCGNCHSIDIHGRTLKKDCDSCHHQKKRKCKSCHRTQSLVYQGNLGGLDLPDPMYEADVSCEDCHLVDDSPKKPRAEVCIECHEEGYDRMMDEWQGEAVKRLKKATEAIEKMRESVRNERGGEIKKVLRGYLLTRAVLDSLRRDGSLGVHNYGLYDELLSILEEKLK